MGNRKNPKSLSIGEVYKVPPINARASSLIPKKGVQAERKVGRNEQCPCGSGKKYKRCCAFARQLPVARACGDCTACCTSLGVAKIDKAPGEVCKYECETGCAIYQRRPKPCAEYRCDWLRGELPADAQPNKLGLIFDGAGTKFRAKWGENAYQVRELYTNAAQSAEAQEIITRLVNEQGATLVICRFEGGRQWLTQNLDHLAEIQRILEAKA